MISTSFCACSVCHDILRCLSATIDITGHSHPELGFSPMITDLCCMAMLHMTPADAYSLLSHLIRMNSQCLSHSLHFPFTLAAGKFVTCTVSGVEGMQLALDNAIERYLWGLWRHMTLILNLDGSTIFSHDWFLRTFIGFLPYPTVLCIIDAFFFDGLSVRFATASERSLELGAHPVCGGNPPPRREAAKKMQHCQCIPSDPCQIRFAGKTKSLSSLVFP
jgi:hypothetical protein